MLIFFPLLGLCSNFVLTNKEMFEGILIYS